MNWKRLWELNLGPIRIRAQATDGAPSSPGYPISRTSWTRALRLLRKYGSESALELVDQRAWKAFERGDDDTARRWRDLIIAIHAVEEDEQLPWESSH